MVFCNYEDDLEGVRSKQTALPREDLRSVAIYELNVRVYMEYWRKQSGVAEQSDADDRLRSARKLDLSSLFLGDAKNMTLRRCRILYRTCTGRNGVQ